MSSAGITVGATADTLECAHVRCSLVGTLDIAFKVPDVSLVVSSIATQAFVSTFLASSARIIALGAPVVHWEGIIEEETIRAGPVASSSRNRFALDL